jgi:CRP-like cAMP-binding protein
MARTERRVVTVVFADLVGFTTLAERLDAEDVALVQNGVMRVEVGGRRLAEIGPGALLGERAVVEGGRRTATLTAVTPCRLAVATADQLDRSALEMVSQGHRREDQP